MEHFRTLLFILILFCFSACSTAGTALPAETADLPSPNPPTETAAPSPTLTPSPAATETPAVPTPTATIDPQSLAGLRPQYVFTATLDYGWRYFTVEQGIDYPNTASETISELTLVVQANWRTDAFHLTRFDIAGKPVNAYTLDGIRLKAILSEPLRPGESVHIDLAYEITIPPIVTSEFYGPNPFGYTTRQMNLTDWYPFVPPYAEGQGWVVHNPWYYGEHLVYPVADFDLMLELVNAPASTLIAASALDEDEGEGYRYRLTAARNLVLSISPEYRLRQERVGDTLVLGYSFPAHDYGGLGAFDTTVEALGLYIELFGPYPFDSLSVVQADFDHGMEYSGLYFLSKAFYNTYNGDAGTFLVSIAAHETAHQWWYGLVGNDQAMEPWLDEALCTYTEKLFYENLRPEGLKWWWDIRVNYYDPAGFIDSSLYDTTGYRPYRDAVYLNGAIFLHELRELVGDQAFFAFLQDYVRRNTGKLATGDNFFSILREHSDADWSELVAMYFQNP